MTTLKRGIASYDDMEARTSAVARGEHRIAPDEPKVWFTSTHVDPRPHARPAQSRSDLAERVSAETASASVRP